jgi:acetylornithine deacetylase/succinyl-diaminopimelate desuccinylase-like protein
MMDITSGEVAELLATLIRNECVNDGTPDSGHEHRSAETITDYLGTEGVAFEPHPGRRSVIWRVPGTTPGAPRIMLMGHTDVVPAPRAGWVVDPFAAERRDGFIWGRGAVDMLDQTAAMAAVAKRHLEGATPRLPGDLLFLAVADEEAAGHLGAEWLVDHHWDEVACEYLITEIAAPSLPWTGGVPVTVAEKGPHWRRLSSRGLTSHGSQPYGARNALLPMADAVRRFAERPPGAEITAQWRRFVAAWNPPGGIAARLLDPDLVDGVIDEIALEDPGLARWIHACTHMTVSPNTLHAGVTANVVPAAADAELDVRTLPGQDEQSVLDHFRKVLAPDLDDEVAVHAVETTPASGSAPEGPLWEAIGDALASMDAAAPVPTMIPVATDARYFRRRGTVCYGLGLFDDGTGFGDFLDMFHGPNERVSEASLAATAAVYGRILEGFGRLTAA